MTTIKLKQYEYVQKEIDSKEIELPEETQYYFQTGIRRAIRIVPRWTTWKKEQENKDEEIFEYKVTFVYGSFECKIEVITIKAYGNSLADSYYSKANNDVSNFVKCWLNDDFDVRTKEQFENDLKQAFNTINHE